jgi:hypothetical protein
VREISSKLDSLSLQNIKSTEPARDGLPRELRPVIATILNALDRDAAEGRQARGEMAAELRTLMNGGRV